MKQQKYKELAEQMLDKITDIEKKYPDIAKSLNILTDSLKQRMTELNEKVFHVEKEDKKVCILIILNKIHRLIEKYLEK